MPGIRATSRSYASLYRAKSNAVQVTQRPYKAPIPEAVGTSFEQPPIIIVRDHILRPRCCHARKKRPRATIVPEAPSVPEVQHKGLRGFAQRTYRRVKRVGLFLLQATLFVSSIMPRISVGIGINPVWPDTWPSFMRRR